MAGIVRQRKKKMRKQTPPKEDTTLADEANKQQEKSDDEKTLWEVFTSHPLGFVLVKVLPLGVFPYVLYVLHHFALLQHSDWIGFLNPRPSIAMSDPRQVLIVGTMSSGTVQVAADLKSKLGLEIGHEDSDSDWSFVRDGTVSWFHGIRFLPPQTKQDRLNLYKTMCFHYTPNMGFHPRMYRSSKLGCSSRFSKWDKCWTRECIDVLNQEWNCVSEQNCEVPFQYNLLQVRNPLRTIESLVAKFCIGGMDGQVTPFLVAMTNALFSTEQTEEELSCIEAAASYVIQYTNAMLDAKEQGLLQGIYKIEDSTPCDVAHLAGLDALETTIHEPNYHYVQELCNSSTESKAQEIMQSSQHKINVDLVQLTWDDLQGGKHGSKQPEGSMELVESVKQLFERLGYDVEQEMDVEDPIFDF